MNKYDPIVVKEMKKLSDKERLAPLSQVGEIYRKADYVNRNPFKKKPLNSRFGICQAARNERHGF